MEKWNRHIRSINKREIWGTAQHIPNEEATTGLFSPGLLGTAFSSVFHAHLEISVVLQPESHIDDLNWFCTCLTLTQRSEEFPWEKTFFLCLTKDFLQSLHPWEFRTLNSRCKGLGSEGERKEFEEAHLHFHSLGKVWIPWSLGIKGTGTQLGSLFPSSIQCFRYSPSDLHPSFKVPCVSFLASDYSNYRWPPKLF